MRARFMLIESWLSKACLFYAESELVQHSVLVVYHSDSKLVAK